MHKKYTLWCLFLFFILICCDVQVIRTNSKEDIEEAKELAKSFYNLISEGNYQTVRSKFRGYISPEEGEEIVKKINSLLGEIKEVKIMEVKTVVKEKGMLIEKEYDLEVEVLYDKAKCLEQLNYEFIDSTFHVVGYISRVQ